MAGGHSLTNYSVRRDRGCFDPQVLLEFDLMHGSYSVPLSHREMLYKGAEGMCSIALGWL